MNLIESNYGPWAIATLSHWLCQWQHFLFGLEINLGSSASEKDGSYTMAIPFHAIAWDGKNSKKL